MLPWESLNLPDTLGNMPFPVGSCIGEGISYIEDLLLFVCVKSEKNLIVWSGLINANQALKRVIIFKISGICLVLVDSKINPSLHGSCLLQGLYLEFVVKKNICLHEEKSGWKTH